MRALHEIQKANKEFEERDEAGAFDENDEPERLPLQPVEDYMRARGIDKEVNRCRECGEEVEDCECDHVVIEYECTCDKPFEECVCE